MSEKRLVWDLPLRVFHWLLVLSVCASWYTAENSEEFVEIGTTLYSYTEIHFYLGYLTLGMLLFRLVWGILGPKHARFSSFITGPKRALADLSSFSSRDSKQAVGHNPMGAWSVVLLLAMVATQAVSGLFIIDNTEIYPAPFHAAVSAETAGTMARIHFANFDILLWMIGLHIVVILFYLFYKHQNLILPMFTGRKSADVVSAEEAIGGSQLLKALIIILVAVGAVWLLLQQAPPPVFEEY